MRYSRASFAAIAFFATTSLLGACGTESDDAYDFGEDGGGRYTPSGANVSIAEQVVGAWGGSTVCVNGQGDQAEFGYWWKLCPNGNLKGFSIIDTEYYFEMLDEGTYAVSEPLAEVRVAYWSTVVNPAIIRGDEDYYQHQLQYDPTTDTLTFETGCPVTLRRLEGEVVNADCE